MEDQDLLLLLVNGDHEAFSIIYKKYWRRIFVAAYDSLQDVKQSQDIVQDIFVRLWEKRADYEIKNLNAYLYSSVRHSVLKTVTSEKVKDSFFAALRHLTMEASSADHDILTAELLKAYHALLEKMPPQRRKIFQMRYEEDLKTREIAERLNITQKTVQNQLLTSYMEVRSIMTEALVVAAAVEACHLAAR